jgi:hypothetical protein
MSRVDLLFAIAASFLLLVCLLQAFVNRGVWWGYLWGLPVVLVVWVFVSPWPLETLS